MASARKWLLPENGVSRKMASARKWLLPGKWRQMLAPDCRQILLDWRQMLAPDWRQIWSQESNLYRKDSRLQILAPTFHQIGAKFGLLIIKDYQIGAKFWLPTGAQSWIDTYMPDCPKKVRQNTCSNFYFAYSSCFWSQCPNGAKYGHFEKFLNKRHLLVAFGEFQNH